MRDPSAAQFFKIRHFFCHGHFQWAPQNRTQAHVLNQERGKDKPAMIPQETKVWKKYCQADTCCLACISFNSQALTARCLCPGSFCTAYCSSGTSAVWLSLAFSPVGAADTFPSPATCSARMETDPGVSFASDVPMRENRFVSVWNLLCKYCIILVAYQ